MAKLETPAQWAARYQRYLRACASSGKIALEYADWLRWHGVTA